MSLQYRTFYLIVFTIMIVGACRWSPGWARTLDDPRMLQTPCCLFLRRPLRALSLPGLR